MAARGGRGRAGAGWGLVLALLAAGCASSAEPRMPGREVISISGDGYSDDITLTRDEVGISSWVDAPPARVWAALPGVMEALAIPVTLSDPAALVIGNQNHRLRRIEGERPSRFLECGHGLAGPNADLYAVTLAVVTQVVQEGAGSALEMMVRGSARPRDVSGGDVSCASTGALERRIVELVSAAVAGIPGGGRASP